MNEKELIQTLFLPLASGFEGSLGLMDDAAVINNLNDKKIVVSKDIHNSGIHFFEDEHPTAIDRKVQRTSIGNPTNIQRASIEHTANIHQTCTEHQALNL